MPNPTIVSASLDDKELQASINQMVANFDKGLQKMLDHSNEYVGKIQASLQKIGDTNFGATGSNGGEVAKQTKAQNDFTDAVKKSTNEIKRQGKETAMSFDQIAAAQQKAVQSQGDSTLKKSFNRQELQQYIDRLRELQAEYIKVNTQQGGGAKSDKIKADMRNLEELIAKYKEILKNLDYVNSRQGTIDVKKWVQDLGAVDDRYKKLVRWYTVLEKEDQRRIASEEKANQKRLADLEKEKAAQDKVIKSYQDSVLKAEFGKVMKMPTANIDEIRAKFERLSSIIANIRELGILSPEKIAAADSEVKKLGASIQRYEKFEQERIASEQKFIIEQAKEVEQTQTLEGRVKGLAQAIRERLKEEGRFVDMQAYGKNLRVYAENDSRAKGLTIEQQILQQLEAEQRVIQQQVSTSQQLNNERKKYVSPTINDDAYQITRNAIARKLGIDAGNVINTDAQYDSIKRVGDALKQLQDAYTRMTNEERNSPIGKQMIRQMQELQRQSQQLRAQMSRPISLKDALSGSEKTLDDIAYKIRRLQSYMQGLDTSNEKSAAEFQRAAMSANLLKEKQNQLLQKNSQLIRSNGELFKSNTALGRSWNYAKNRLAFYFTIGASTQFIKQLVDIRSQYEMNERALGILINSAERGTQIFNELSQMALVSPYTLIELSNAAKQLTAYDIAAKDVVDTTRRLADMASAVGVPMERLTYALGQIKAYGYLNSRDNRMFANAGIPLVKQLSDYYTELEGKLVSTADVYDRIKKKAVSFEDTMGVIYKMTDEGGKFFDFQEKMAGTLKVQLANLNLAWNNMLNDMGSESQGVLTAGIGALKNLFLAWKDIEKALTEIIVAFGVVKGIQMLSTVAIGKQTVKTLEYVAANKLATASEYKRALSINGLNAQQARWLILTNQSNKALVTAIMRMGVLDKAIVSSLATMTGLKRGFAMLLLSGKMAISGLVTGFKTLGTAILSNWPMVLLMAGMDLFMHMSRVAENNKELNKNIADGAKEATKALNDFLTAEDKVQMRLEAQNKSLTKAQGVKAWESVREQIELSAMSAKQIIPELIDIPDINDRITKSFELAERIQKATEALQGLEDELEVSQDSWLNGVFGEGLEEDIEDFVDAKKKLERIQKEEYSLWDYLLYGAGNKENNAKLNLESQRIEAEKEIKAFANDAAEVIKERLGEEGIKDNIQVGEAIERVIKETEAKFPRIARGVGKKLFESIVSDTMGEQFKGVYDAQEQYYKLFLEQLGKDYGSKFRDITEDIKKDTFDWSKAQEDAINKTADKIKQDLPEASQDAINQILKQLNTTEFKMRIVAEFATKDNDDVQKAFDKEFYDRETMTLPDDEREKKRTENVQKYQAFRIKAGEDTAEYEKRISDEREKQEKLAKKTQAIIDKGGDSAVLARAKEENEAAAKWLSNMKEVEKWGGYDFSKDKKGGGNKKDPMLDTLKETINIAKKLQSEYDTLTKSGASSADALDDVRKRYSRTINLLNKDLKGFGLPEIDVNMIKGRNPNDVLEYFQKISDILTQKGLSTLERQKAVEVIIQEFSLKAKTYNLDMITKGLNNELGKLKDEYELAVELDANPELGNIFADMFDINVQDLPRSIEEYASRAVDKLNKAIKERGDNVVLPTLFLTKDDIEAYREMSKEGKLNKESLKDIEDSDKKIRDLREKAAVDVSKIANEYIKEYGDLAAQIALIEQEKDTNLTKLNAVYYTEGLRQTQRYVDAKFAIEDGARRKEAKATFEALKKETDYERFFTAIDTLTRTDALSIKNKIKQGIINAFKSGAITVSQFGKEIKALEEQFDKLSQTTSNWVSYLNGGFDKLIQRTKQTGQELETIGERMAIEGKVDDKDKNYLDSLGKIFSSGTGGKTNFSSLMGQFSGNIKGLGGAVSQAGQGMQAGASKFMQAIAIIDTVIKNIHQTVQAIDSVFQELNSTRNEENKIGGALWEGFKKYDNYAYSGWENLKSGNIAGAVADTANSIISIANTFEEIKNKRINDEIKESERSVKQLELAYIDLEHAADEAYGTSIIGAKQAAAENKRLQLAELRRQLQLEEARSKKRRDEDKIIDLRKQIKELEYDIKNTTKEITNDLLGISSVGDAAENLIKNIIDAFRDGKYKLKDIMKDIKASFNDMIAEMLVKLLTTKLVEPWLDEQWKKIESEIANKNKAQIDQMNNLIKHKSFIESYGDAGDTAEWIYDNDRAKFQELYRSVLAPVFGDVVAPGDLNEESRKAMFDWLWSSGYAQKIVDAYVGGLDSSISQLSKEASKVTLEDIKRFGDYLNSSENPLEDEKVIKFIEDLARQFGLIGDKKQSTLSALQQGLQSMSEDTANSLEAYMNGVSQQVYLHSNLLTQIRDTVAGFDMDVQTATQAQMLLQLQQSYTVQMSIESILQGVLNPSGQGFRVELLS